MEILMNIAFFTAGLLCGVIVMGVLSSHSYNKGYEDAKREIRELGLNS